MTAHEKHPDPRGHFLQPRDQRGVKGAIVTGLLKVVEDDGRRCRQAFEEFAEEPAGESRKICQVLRRQQRKLRPAPGTPGQGSLGQAEKIEERRWIRVATVNLKPDAA